MLKLRRALGQSIFDPFGPSGSVRRISPPPPSTPWMGQPPSPQAGPARFGTPAQTPPLQTSSVAGGSCGPGFIPSLARPDSSYCPPNKMLRVQQAPDETWCYQCVDVGIPAQPYSPMCPAGWKDLPPIDCPSGQTLFNQTLSNGSTCYQCAASSPAPGAAQAAFDQQYGPAGGGGGGGSTSALYQTMLNQYYQLQQQQMQQSLAQQQAYLNAVAAAQAAAQPQPGAVPGAMPGAAPSAAPPPSAAAPPSPSGTETSYPAGLTPPPSTGWKNLGIIVLALGGAALVLNKFGKKKGAAGGGRRPTTHRIEKKESFDVEV